MCKILVVDRDIKTRTLIRLSLREYEISETDNGSTALEIMKSTAPKVVLFNLSTPHWELFVENKSPVDTIAVAITESKNEEKMKYAFDVGVDDVIYMKPFFPVLLKCKIDKLRSRQVYGKVSALLTEVSVCLQQISTVLEVVNIGGGRNSPTTGKGLSLTSDRRRQKCSRLGSKTKAKRYTMSNGQGR